MNSRPLLPLAFVLAPLALGACGEHSGLWGPPGGDYVAAVVITGTSDATGVKVSVDDRNDESQDSTTGADGTYSFWCGDDDGCRIVADAPSTLEGEISIDFRGGDGVAPPPNIVFTGLGSIEGTVTVGGHAPGNVGIVVAIEGTSYTAITGGDGRYILGPVPAGPCTLIATLDGHTPVSADGQLVSYTRVTEAATMDFP